MFARSLFKLIICQWQRYGRRWFNFRKPFSFRIRENLSLVFWIRFWAIYSPPSCAIDFNCITGHNESSYPKQARTPLTLLLAQ